MTTYTEAGETLSNDNMPEGHKESSDHLWRGAVERMEQDLAAWIKAGGPIREELCKTRTHTAIGLIRADQMS